MRLELRRRTSQSSRCVFCHDALGERASVCTRCGTWFHAECAGACARCPTLGCQSLVCEAGVAETTRPHFAEAIAVLRVLAFGVALLTALAAYLGACSVVSFLLGAALAQEPSTGRVLLAVIFVLATPLGVVHVTDRLTARRADTALKRSEGTR